jgi:hypothetical protein
VKFHDSPRELLKQAGNVCPIPPTAITAATNEARAPLVSDDQSLLTVAAGHGFAALPLG